MNSVQKKLAPRGRASGLTVASVLAGLCGVFGCANQTSAPINVGLIQDPEGAAAKYDLYVASGTCYAGGAATSTPTNVIVAVDPETGTLKRTVVDYNLLAPGDSPIAIANFDSQNLIVTVENAGGRRVDVVRKDGSGLISTYLVNATAFTAALRSLFLLPDRTMMIVRPTAIERFSPARARVLVGANPYVNAPAGTCATSTTAMSDVWVLSNGKIIFAHAGATPNNKMGLIASTGYSVVGDCLSSQNAPNTTALPSRVIVHSSGRVITAYGSATAASNSLHTYVLNPISNVWSGAVAAYTDFSLVNGPSAMVEHPGNNLVYVANGAATHNSIERYQINTSTGALTRIGNSIGPTYFTRCVSGLVVAPE